MVSGGSNIDECATQNMPSGASGANNNAAPSETLYSLDQVKVPPGFPDVLKNFTKYILEKQPADLILASTEYFSQLNRTSKSSVKKAVTPLQLEMLFHRFTQKNETEYDVDTVVTLCSVCQISAETVRQTLRTGEFQEKVPWVKFWALLTASTTSDLLTTIETVLQILAGENERVNTKILLEVFLVLTARDSSITPDKLKDVIKQLGAVSELPRSVALDIVKSQIVKPLE